MLRLILFLWLLASPVLAAETPFVRNDLFPAVGPATARGAFVWVPGMYGRDQTGPPDPPDIVGRYARTGLDVFQFNRPRDNDPLAGGEERLLIGLRDLRDRGYRRIVVAGHSRGAWIALTAMAHPGAADAIVAISVAAHGIRPERQPQARADWAHLWSRARGTETRVVLVQLTGDPYDPDPGWRRDTAIGSSARPVSIFLPPEPTGHVGVYEPAFDEALGAAVLRATGD